MSAATPIAEFHGVSKTHDGITHVVRDLNLSIARGEFLTLLGPSGAGKTTCLMMLAGILPPSAGEIRLRGQLVTRTPSARRGIGVVFQANTLLGHKTVAENVAIGLADRRLSRGERAAQVTRALDMARLSDLGDRRPAQLSGGQQQRVALARAMLDAPDLLLMDEPLGTLDRALRDELLTDLRGTQRRLGLSLLYVTHDQMEALSLSDRVAVLHRGALRQLAAPETIYEHPADAFVAGFVGENNLLPGQVIAVEDEIAQIRLRAGPVVEARVADARRVGDHCVVAIRPESVALVAAAARDMGEDALSAVVIDIAYRGDHRRIRVTIGEGADLIVRRPTAAGLGGLVVGQPAAVAWQGYHARAFLRPT